jgi:CMP-2-keto-3-deoxyoctulosonic acid synthetase
VLDEHRQLVQRVTETVNQALSLPEDQRGETSKGLRELLDGLHSVREGLLKAGKDYLMVVTCCLERNEDLEALIGYYVMAGQRIEQEAITKAGRLVAVSDDLKHVKETVSGLQELLIQVSGLRGRSSR